MSANRLSEECSIQGKTAIPYACYVLDLSRSHRSFTMIMRQKKKAAKLKEADRLCHDFDNHWHGNVTRESEIFEHVPNYSV